MPGDTVRQSVVLDGYFDLREPGTYEVWMDLRTDLDTATTVTEIYVAEPPADLAAATISLRWVQQARAGEGVPEAFRLDTPYVVLDRIARAHSETYLAEPALAYAAFEYHHQGESWAQHRGEAAGQPFFEAAAERGREFERRFPTSALVENVAYVTAMALYRLGESTLSPYNITAEGVCGGRVFHVTNRSEQPTTLHYEAMDGRPQQGRLRLGAFEAAGVTLETPAAALRLTHEGVPIAVALADRSTCNEHMLRRPPQGDEVWE